MLLLLTRFVPLRSSYRCLCSGRRPSDTLLRTDVFWTRPAARADGKIRKCFFRGVKPWSSILEAGVKQSIISRETRGCTGRYAVYYIYMCVYILYVRLLKLFFYHETIPKDSDLPQSSASITAWFQEKPWIILEAVSLIESIWNLWSIHRVQPELDRPGLPCPRALDSAH